MTITVQPTETTATKRVPMDRMRKTALVAGGLYLLSFSSIPTLALYAGLEDPDFILGSGSDTPLLWGGFLEIVVAVACIGTGIALYPVVKRQNEGVALGFVAARILEAGLIMVGVVSVLSLVTLREDLAGTAGADAASLVATGTSLVATHDWTFLLGQGLIPGVNALLLGSLMYRSGLVPHVIPLLGLIGGPLLLAAGIPVIFGIYEQLSVWRVPGTLLVAAWEFSLGVYLVVKGFKPSPIATGWSLPTLRARVRT